MYTVQPWPTSSFPTCGNQTCRRLRAINYDRKCCLSDIQLVAAYSDLQCNSVTFNGQGQTHIYLSAKRLRRVCLRHAVNYRRCSLIRRRYSSVQMPATTNGANKGCAGKYQRSYYTYLPRAPHTRARKYRRAASAWLRHFMSFQKTCLSKKNGAASFRHRCYNNQNHGIKSRPPVNEWGQ